MVPLSAAIVAVGVTALLSIVGTVVACYILWQSGPTWDADDDDAD